MGGAPPGNTSGLVDAPRIGGRRDQAGESCGSMETLLVGDGRKSKERCLISIRDLLERWIRYYEKLDSTAFRKRGFQCHTIMVNTTPTSDMWRNLSLL
jgi:hypothetical protein